MPNHAIVGDLRIRDLGIEARLNPRRVRLLNLLRQGRSRAGKWLQRAPNSARRLAVPTDAHAAGIDQRSAFTTRKPRLQEPAGTFGYEADHREAIALPGLDLEPTFAATRSVRGIRPLRDSSLQTHSARPRVQVRAVLEVLAV
jgi:hypothetical protein